MRKIYLMLSICLLFSVLSKGQENNRITNDNSTNYYDNFKEKILPLMTKSAAAVGTKSAMVAENALVLVDMAHNNDGVIDGLTALGYTTTVATGWSDFNVQLASGGFSIAVAFAQNSSSFPNFDITGAQNYIDSGGKMIFATWTSADEPIANLFEAHLTGNNNRSTVTVTDPDVASGITNPFTLTNPGWGVFSTGLGAIGDGEVLATFENGDAAMVSGNSGQTIMLGYLSDAPVSERQAIFENIVKKLSRCLDIVVDNDPGICGATVTYDAPSAEGATVTQVDESGLSSGDVFPVGETIQEYEFDFGAGGKDTCSFTVTVNDVESPTFRPGGEIVPADPVTISQLGRKSTYSNVKLNSESNTITVAPGSTVNLKANWTSAYDGGAGCPGCITQHYIGLGDIFSVCHRAGSGLGVVDVNFTAPSVPGVYYINQRATWWYSCYQFGTPVHDNDPNTAIAVLIVNDASYPENITAANDPEVCGAVINFDTPVGIDNCSSTTTVQTDGLPSGSEFPVGTTTNTFIATDATGNTASCSFTVTVVDEEAPVPIANPIEVVLDETGRYELTPEDMEEMATGTADNCTPSENLKLSAYPRVFYCDDVTETMHVRLTVEDASANIDRQWTTVTVLDTIPPTAVCQDMEVYLDENGEAMITAEEVNLESFDACGIESMELDIALFGCDDAGENTVTLTVADPSGNTATCTAVVTVHDTFPPVFEPVADIELELEAGVFETVISYPDIIVTDNCAVEPQLTEGLGPDGLFPAGTTTETWVVADPAGNMASLSFTVTVTAVNSPPVLVNPIADQIVNASYSLKVPVNPLLGELFDDADGDELTVEVTTEDGSAMPAWANVVNDTIVFSPLIADTGCVNIVVQATDPDGATAADTFQLCVDGYPVSAPLVNAANLEVTMYPNPTKDRVTLEINSVVSGPSEVTVFTVTGTQVLHRKFSDTQNISFSMKNHVSGMYFVKLNTNGKEVVKKLVLDKK